MSLTTIRAPFAASLRAAASPIPLPDPVITATLPSNSPIAHASKSSIIDAFAIPPPSLYREWIANRRRLEAELKQMRDPARQAGEQILASKGRPFQGPQRPRPGRCSSWVISRPGLAHYSPFRRSRRSTLRAPTESSFGGASSAPGSGSIPCQA
jgi:hypothetical protein